MFRNVPSEKRRTRRHVMTVGWSRQQQCTSVMTTMMRVQLQLQVQQARRTNMAFDHCLTASVSSCFFPSVSVFVSEAVFVVWLLKQFAVFICLSIRLSFCQYQWSNDWLASLCSSVKILSNHFVAKVNDVRRVAKLLYCYSVSIHVKIWRPEMIHDVSIEVLIYSLTHSGVTNDLFK